MARHTYGALVSEMRTRFVQVTVDVPDGRSPWGPDARKAAQRAALDTPPTDWQDPRQKVQLTTATPES